MYRDLFVTYFGEQSTLAVTVETKVCALYLNCLIYMVFSSYVGLRVSFTFIFSIRPSFIPNLKHVQLFYAFSIVN